MHVLVTNSVSNERAEFAVYIWGEGETHVLVTNSVSNERS